MDMPGLDGAQLCLALREHPRLREVPMAILSGTLYHDDPRVRGIGSCAVMLEPMPNKNLLTAVEQLLVTRRHHHDDISGYTPAIG